MQVLFLFSIWRFFCQRELKYAKVAILNHLQLEISNQLLQSFRLRIELLGCGGGFLGKF